ncbi:phospholipase D family protein [Lelliottia sp. V89_10]|uniref:phospholipase D family nuclease n=1 Tax=Lelliottia wanjuensis TaxID=3050585 RepID=UPI00249ED3A7|nr:MULTISPECIES: phospholipase D family protein [unclassified Lelliottia]MDI3360330.1 phospholipase D family protein [Lelliottia sp. V89_13]MDK9549444.1 phospholipase D family protein [Lelliottia sp. V89_5]MDK9596141.1 phospholipase D family protein [Lelliottia sp. V89_10]
MKTLMPALLLLITLPAQACKIDIGFTPSDSALANVINVINSASSSLDVEAYSFTSRDIAGALLKAKERGVTVRVVADEKANTGKYSAVTWLVNNGVNVRLNGQYAIMHNKVIIADNKHIETGSFNFTSSAIKRNAENNLVIYNCPDVAIVYSKEFNRLWNESAEQSPNY